METTGVTRQEPEIWQSLGSLEDTFEALDSRDYFFMGDKDFEEAFAREKKQIPISFCAPVLYVNTYLVPDTGNLSKVTSLKQLTMDGQPSYCVGVRDREMYRRAFGAGKEDPAFAVKMSGTRDRRDSVSVPGNGNASVESIGEQGYEPFLRREKAYYLGTTDDYEAVRASLGGIYQMIVLEDLWKEGRVKGRFTHLWSIRASLDEEERRAADHMVYYLLGERAQDIFNVQSGNGLSLNRRIMEVYVDNNDEFRPVMELLEELEMEY